MAIKGAWVKSKLKAEDLLPYIAQGVIPERKRNRWRVPSDEEIPTPNPGEFVVFLSFLDRGLSFPTSHFFRRLLAYYGINISDLGPHSIQQISFLSRSAKVISVALRIFLYGSLSSTGESPTSTPAVLCKPMVA